MANESTVSKATCYQEIGAFWDEHDATEFGDDEEVEFELRLISQRHYYAVDAELHARLQALADRRGIRKETLVNLLLKERLDQFNRECGE